MRQYPNMKFSDKPFADREPTELDHKLISWVIFILMAFFAVGIGVICVSGATGFGVRLFEFWTH